MRSASHDSHALAERRENIAELYLRGKSIRTIASETGIPKSTVHDDLKAVHRQWVESATETIGQYKQQQIQLHVRIIEAAWNEWERSKEDSVKTVVGHSGENDIDTTTTVGQCGDPRYLQTIQKSSDAICKLLGLNEPEKHEHSMGEAESNRNRLSEFLANLAQRSAN